VAILEEADRVRGKMQSTTRGIHRRLRPHGEAM
jgi:hypothetical protein